MPNELPTANDWVRAATLAQMLLSQSLSDEELDELITRTATEPEPVPEAA